MPPCGRSLVLVRRSSIRLGARPPARKHATDMHGLGRGRSHARPGHCFVTVTISWPRFFALSCLVRFLVTRLVARVRPCTPRLLQVSPNAMDLAKTASYAIPLAITFPRALGHTHAHARARLGHTLWRDFARARAHKKRVDATRTCGQRAWRRRHQ